jgi:hypothetical protein
VGITDISKLPKDIEDARLYCEGLNCQCDIFIGKDKDRIDSNDNIPIWPYKFFMVITKPIVSPLG